MPKHATAYNSSSKSAMSYRDLPLRYIRDPRLGHRLGRNFPSGIFHDPIWNTPWLGTNKQGFYGMDAEISPNRDGDPRIRVLLLGGSAAMGLGATTRGALLANVTESELKRIGLNAVVINAAVGDYASCQQVSYLVSELVEFDFDVLVTLDGFNDFASGTFGTKFEKDWVPNTTRSYDDGVNAILSWDKSFDFFHRMQLRYNYSRLSNSLAKIRQHFSDREPHAAKSTHGLHRDDPDYWMIRDTTFDWYFRNLRTMYHIAIGRGASFVSVLQPSLLYRTKEVTTELESELLNKYDSLLPKISTLAPHYYRKLSSRFNLFWQTYCGEVGDRSSVVFENGALWLDPQSQTCYSDPFHYNDYGQSVLGKMLAHCISRSLTSRRKVT